MVGVAGVHCAGRLAVPAGQVLHDVPHPQLTDFPFANAQPGLYTLFAMVGAAGAGGAEQVRFVPFFFL